ncbi:MAG: hypothetical protein IJE26_06710 [Oscillospiraceae bacterium]|nr:hypothetical protein [Oscillospiraceae bacterium]
MNEQQLLHLLGSVDDELVTELADSLSLSSTVERRTAPMKFTRTLLIAAVIASILALSVFAVGYSIHQRRQSELNADLGAAENNVASYVEYEAPTEDAPGLTLLSTIREDIFQRVYVNIAPVEQALVEGYPNEESFFFSVDGEHWGSATPVLKPGRSLSGLEEIREAILADAYDADTKTLTLECYIPAEYLEAQGGSGELIVAAVSPEEWEASGEDSYVNYAAENGRLYGPVAVALTAQEMRRVDFENAVFNVNGEEVTLVGLELRPTGCSILYKAAAAERYNTSREGEMEYIALSDAIVGSASLNFADGSSMELLSPMNSSFEDGIASENCQWTKTIDISTVESLTILGETLTLTRG